MNVDWDWIKQRPHFLAEKLSASNNVYVFYPYTWRRSNLVRNPREGVKLFPLFRLPFGGRLKIIKRINFWIWKFYFSILLKFKNFDFIWISSPEIFETLPINITPEIIYDCMDDVLGFYKNQHSYEYILEAEERLIKKSKHIFCSSTNLANKILRRGGHEDKYTVVFNGFEPINSVINSQINRSNIRYDLFRIGYIGTISSWFDFSVILEAVIKLPNVIFYIIGPEENLIESKPDHERIVFLGPIQHNELHQYSIELNLLVMPFIVNSLVKSVDPVKIYEYIYFDKPIVSVYYAGLEKFERFVDFYIDKNEFVSIIKKYLNGSAKKKYSSLERESFLLENSWDKRCLDICSTLSRL
ncbi:hypothetical protein [Polynucleobacter sp. MG-27-Goln-C1]|uniref:hypothetical protein n=1 Tax=Polynucleobacter sp. MG-27-Goln-C1 TaxID=1819726 RepID=UPI001C0ACDE6|nr:hypothetical protein [Polynucleobacter sp. MG-27-Goln-C1]MBU3612859.1 hypothetical protein [Polynucleobacter sp. MG-27-Goln-C1]